MVGKIVNALVKIRILINEKKINQENISQLKFGSKENNIYAAAYSWLHEKLKRENTFFIQSDNLNSKSFRISTEDEIKAIGIENYNYLFHLYNIGLITYLEFDAIIEELKIMPMGMINQGQINVLLLSIYLELEQFSIPGSRILLHSTDTIN